MILKFFLVLFSFNAFATPEQYSKNDDVVTSVAKVGDKTYFKFGFRDHRGAYAEWRWTDKTERLESISTAFGLYGKNPDNYQYFPEELPPALFKEHYLLGAMPDYSAIVSYYHSTVTELYKSWKRFVLRENLSRRQSVEVLLLFFQDFPYGIPPGSYNNRMISGLFVPSLVISNGWADCDSKSLMMATVLAHDEFFRDKLAMILVPGHALLGVSLRPQAYDETYSHRRKEYIVAEATGLARTPFGRKNSPYKKVLSIEPITVSGIPTVSLEETTDSSVDAPSAKTALQALTQSDCTDGAILVDYKSVTKGVRVQMCQVKENGEYVKHGPEIIFNESGLPQNKAIYDKGRFVQ